jgi:hypothetical protein
LSLLENLESMDSYTALEDLNQQIVGVAGSIQSGEMNNLPTAKYLRDLIELREGLIKKLEGINSF